MKTPTFLAFLFFGLATASFTQADNTFSPPSRNDARLANPTAAAHWHPNLTGDNWRYLNGKGRAVISQTQNKLTIKLIWDTPKKHDEYIIQAVLSRKGNGVWVFEGPWDLVRHAPGHEGHLEGRVLSDDRIKIGDVNSPMDTNLVGLELYRN